ncbi:MAG: DUF6398 domain-containing protein [Actinomycetota bacterium]
MGRKGRHRRGGRTTPKGTRPPGTHRSGESPYDDGPADHPADGPGLMDQVAEALADDHPLGLLAHASTLLAVVDPRTDDPFDRDGDETLGRDGLLAAMLEVRRRETSALLAAVSHLLGDELLAARVRRELAARADDLPAWLVRMGEAEAYQTMEMTHVLGDGDNVLIGARFPTGHEMTAVVYIDHNLGSLVKDAFVLPEGTTGVVAFFRQAAGADADTRWADLDPADARARITEAITRGAMTVPRIETETWPAAMALVEWMAGLLPTGGTGYVRPEWSEQDQDDLRDRFLASPMAAALDPDQQDFVQHLLWFGTGYGPGDPLRWSPVAVEIVLEDWVPRKIMADAAYLAKAPDVLRAFIRFCHAERAITPALTAETLAAVDRFEPAYQRTIRSPRPQGAEAILAAMAAMRGEPGLFDDEFDDDFDDDFDADFDDEAYWREGRWAQDNARGRLAYLAREVGGEAVLDALDDRPLPDEPMDWTGTPDDIRPKVDEVLSLCDRFCDERLTTEYRTACRRILARAASGDPAVFRRKARADTAAAAICWAVARANNLFTLGPHKMMARDLAGWFGLTSAPSQRAGTLLRAAGLPQGYEGDLGTVDLLVGSYRRFLLSQRDHFRSQLDRPAT